MRSPQIRIGYVDSPVPQLVIYLSADLLIKHFCCGYGHSQLMRQILMMTTSVRYAIFDRTLRTDQVSVTLLCVVMPLAVKINRLSPDFLISLSETATDPSASLRKVRWAGRAGAGCPARV